MEGLIIESITEYGILGILIAVLIYQVFYLQHKFVSIIENNTKAMARLVDAVNDNSNIVNETTKVIQLCKHNQR